MVIVSASYFIVDHVRQFIGYLVSSLVTLLGHLIFLVRKKILFKKNVIYNLTFYKKSY